jgi:hypothetical protein
MELHLGVWRETVRHFDSKERPGKALCCVTHYTIRNAIAIV